MTKKIQKNVLITGVASGIGRAQAAAFLADGYKVYGLDKNPTDLTHEDFSFYQVDVTSSELELVVDKLPAPDILCNTAGILDGYRPLLEQTELEFEETFAVNFFGMVKLTRLILPKMIAKKSGIIINMASIASLVAGGGGAAYTSSKHAVAGFTKQLALDYARSCVQIFALAPGAIRTGMTVGDFEGDGKMAKWVAEETPVGRWAEASEVADLTMFLASGKASYMHGSIIPIDGGWLLK
ncbi:3-oxoacyl-ACP reductase [Streptococcaceae bacterium ESL0729]|nr:3-oxoacyl-ACP reductase [Streptococcaceae bacterium ESL0729]